ncbi:MAG: hypothetical protein Q9208_002629 [Pyrenodesmia sp. 3 TL-2023]
MYYFGYSPITACFLLSFFADLTRQVDIAIIHSVPIPGLDMRSTCPGISPGICCRAPPLWSQREGTVIFRGLEALDLAAIWRERWRFNDNTGAMRSIRGCSGSVLESRSGPGIWIWSPGRLDPVHPEGASFIKIPEALPPDPSMYGWMMAEGLLGLAWGGGSWFISEKAKRLLGGVSRKGRRDIRSEVKAHLWARSPMRECFPKWIDVNGTRYEDEGTEGKVYKDGNGEVLNTTAWFNRDPL